MRQVSATLAAAIESSERTPRVVLSVDWDGDGHGPQPGTTSTVTSTVTATDAYSRTSTGPGVADTGQQYSIVSGALAEIGVTPGHLNLAVPTVGAERAVALPGVGPDLDVTIFLSPTIVAGGGPFEQKIRFRHNGVDWYEANVQYKTSGFVDLYLVRGVATVLSALGNVLPYNSSTTYGLRVTAVGTTVQQKLWDAIGPQPAAWNAIVTDSGLPGNSSDNLLFVADRVTGSTDSGLVLQYKNLTATSIITSSVYTPSTVDGSLDDLSERASMVTVTSVLQTTLPDQVAAVEGTASATFSVDLAGGSDRQAAVRYFSPFATDSPLYGKPRLNRDVHIDVEFSTDAGWESVWLMRGRSRALPVKATDRTAQLTGMDYRSMLRTPVQLPAMAAQVPRVGNLAPCMPGLEGTWIVSYVLWMAGFPLSPPPPDGCRLWMPMHGSAMPFVSQPFQGSPIAYYQQQPNAGNFPGAPIEFDNGPFVLANRQAKNSGEVFFLSPNPAAGTAMFDTNGNTSGRITVWMKRDPAGSGLSVTMLNGRLDTATFVPGATTAALQLNNNGVIVNVACPRGTKLDNQWHLFGVDWNDRTGVATFNVDGQLYPVTFSGTGVQPGADDNFFFEIQGGNQFAELQVSTGTSAATPWPDPTYVAPATVDRSALRLDGIVPGAASEAWAILQELATAEQGAVFLDPLPVYATRSRLVSTDAQTPNRVFDAAPHIMDLAHDYSLDKVLNTLSADYQPVALGIQVEAWKPQGTVSVPPLSVAVFEASYPGLASSARRVVARANGLANGGGIDLGFFGSGYTNPTMLMDVEYTSDTTARITVTNRNSGTAFLVDPTGTTVFSLIGDTVSQASAGAPVVVVDQDSVDMFGPQPLSMPANRWTQTRAWAWGLALVTLRDLSTPQPVFTGLVVPGDPRLQFFDRVTLTDPYLTGMDIDVWVTGKTHTLEAGRYDMTLSARPARNRFVAGTGMAGIDLVG